MPEKLKSRKLWVTIVGAILSIVYPEAIPILKFLIPSYVIGQGFADGMATKP